jgi:hypothetical protein
MIAQYATMTTLGMGDRISIPIRARLFSTQQSLNHLSGPPILLLVGSVVLSKRLKRPRREANRTHHILLTLMREAIPPLPHTSAWRGSQTSTVTERDFTSSGLIAKRKKQQMLDFNKHPSIHSYIRIQVLMSVS